MEKTNYYVKTPYVTNTNEEFSRLEVGLIQMSNHFPSGYTTRKPRNVKEFQVIACNEAWSPDNRGPGIYMWFNNRWNKQNFS